MNSFRLFTYLGFCIGSVWCVTNTPIGEYTMKKFRFMEMPPADPPRTEEYSRRFDEHLIRRARGEIYTPLFDLDGSKQKKNTFTVDPLQKHFKGLPQGKPFYLNDDGTIFNPNEKPTPPPQPSVSEQQQQQ